MDNTNYTSHSISSGHIKKQFESDLENISFIHHSNHINQVNYAFQKNTEKERNKNEIEKIMDANSMLSSQIYHLTSERNDLLNQIDTYSNDINSLENQYDKANKEILHFRRKVDSLTSDNREYKSHISILQLENSNLNAKINQYTTNNDELKNTIKDYQNQIEAMQNEIQNIQTQTIQFDTLSNEFVKLKNKYHLLLKSTSSNELTSDTSIDPIQKENKKLRINLELFYNENHAAAIRIKELEDKIEKMNNINRYNNNKENKMLHKMVKSLNKKIELLQVEIYSLNKTRKAKSIDHYKSYN